MTTRLLVLDAGNTNIVVGAFDGTRLETSWRLSTAVPQTVDELTLKLGGLFVRDGLDPRSFSAAVIASVVPPLTDTLKQGVQVLLGVEALVVKPGIKTGMKILVDRPEEVGADRIVNSVAAYEIVKDTCIVVDFGTATTFDCVTNEGDYLGGVIAPGLGISAEALFRSAARLPRVEVARPAKVIGKTTVTAMQSGLFHGYAGLVDGILERLVAEMGGQPRVLATGGLADLMGPGSRFIDEVCPHLTLDGLRILHERNA